jgi:uncharacterized membrane protein YedE/YeeE
MSGILVGLICGFIFGLGLCLSGLADPSVVQGFLDVAGAWNPALLFVMGAGLTVTLIGYRLVFGGVGRSSRRVLIFQPQRPSTRLSFPAL